MTVASDGWIAARLSSDARDSYLQPIFAHTSPVYVKAGVGGPERQDAARWFDDSIERSLGWVSNKGKFYTDSQQPGGGGPLPPRPGHLQSHAPVDRTGPLPTY